MAVTTAKVLGGLIDIVMAFRPIDMQDAAGEHVTGDWISLKNWGRVLCVLMGGAGTAGQDPVLTIEQASTNTGTGVKALTFDTINRKQAATDLLSTAVWAVTVQTAAGTYTNTDAAEQVKIHVVEFKATDLDVDGGFDHIRMTVPDVGGAAQLGAGLYILAEPRYPNAPANVLSPL